MTRHYNYSNITIFYTMIRHYLSVDYCNSYIIIVCIMIRQYHSYTVIVHATVSYSYTLSLPTLFSLVSSMIGTGKQWALCQHNENFGIIWNTFCLMQIFSKNLRADLLRMQDIILNYSGNTIKSTQNLIFPQVLEHTLDYMILKQG